MMNNFLLRQLRKGYEAGIDLSQYIQYGIDVLHEIRRAELENIDLSMYVEEGYDGEQLNAIRQALEKHLEIDPYLSKEYHGSAILEIAKGLEDGVDVSRYANVNFTWRKMREIRLGLEHNIDITKYEDPRYSCWQMKEIRLGLEQGLDVEKYKNFMFTANVMKHKRESMLSERNGENEQYKVIRFPHGKLYIRHDEMEAELEITDDEWKPDYVSLLELLKTHNIRHGYNELALLEIETKRNILGKRITVAVGTPPKHGLDGKYQFNFDMGHSVMPKDGEDGLPVFDEVLQFERIVKGDTLATYYPATKGVDGTTITGKTIFAHDGKELPKLWGKGISLLEDGRTYTAMISGRVLYHHRFMEVEELTKLCDERWEHTEYSFSGTVWIPMDVPEGIKIYATGDIIVDGKANGCTLISDRNIVVRLGVNRGAAGVSLTAKENVMTKYCEYADIHAGKNIYLSNSLNSNLDAGGNIVTFGMKGRIIGGNAYAERGFCVANVGNTMKGNTKISFGMSDHLQQELLELQLRFKRENEKLDALQDTWKKIQRSAQFVGKIRDSVIDKLYNSIYEQARQVAQIKAENELMIQRIDKAKRAQVIVNYTIHTNVLISCMGEFYLTKEMEHVSIKYDGTMFRVDQLQIGT